MLQASPVSMDSNLSAAGAMPAVSMLLFTGALPSVPLMLLRCAKGWVRCRSGALAC